MFTFDLEEAISWIAPETRSIVKFVVFTADSKKLSVYYPSASSLMGVFENILEIRESIINYCLDNGYKYSCLIGVSYVI